MFISNLSVRNWKNFTKFDVPLGELVYVIGPNASGKSNLLDIFRFMRDIANPTGGGLQSAVDVRHGLKRIRSLAARKAPQVQLSFEFKTSMKDPDAEPDWRYELWINYEGAGRQRAVVKKEEVYKGKEQILLRPDEDDKKDPERLTVTHLEQVHMNREFREIAAYFQDVMYLHLVPQLLKYSEELSSRKIESDPFGQGILDNIAAAPAKAQKAKLRHMERVLHHVIPHFSELKFERDSLGKPHLKMRYNHWRPNAGWQTEEQFSDGTLRLIAMMWILLSNNSMILLEEPELSLHANIVRQIPKLIHGARQYIKKPGGQLIVSTHSEALLSDKSTDATYLILKPGTSGESTTIEQPSAEDVIAMRSGLSAADVLLPKTGTLIGKVNGG